MKKEPKLVDYSLFQKPKIKRVQSLNIPRKDNSLIINLICLLIICIGGLFLYQRLIKKEEKELERQNIIIGFNQYVKEKIK